MLQAKNLMQSPVPYISNQATIEEVFQRTDLTQQGFLVVGDRQRAHGLLQEASLIRIYLKSKQQPERSQLMAYRQEFSPIQYAHQEETFGDILKKVLTAIGHQVLVLDERQQIKGYISLKHLLPHLIGERERVSKKTQESWESDLYFYESFFDKAPFMMHSVNAEGRIQMANEMLHIVLGYAYPDLVGQHFLQLYTPENWLPAEKGVKLILKEGFHQVVRSQMQTKDKKSIEVELASRALHNIRGQSIGTVTVSRPLDMNVLIQSLRQAQNS